MYLFSRSRRLNSAAGREAVAGAVEIAQLAGGVAGIEIGVWATVASTHADVISWAATFATLAEFEAANAKLNASAEYGDWSDNHDHLYEGPPADTMLRVVHATSDQPATFNVMSIVNTVCTPGRLAEGLSGGVELANTASTITGMPFLFCVAATGPYGRVVWLTGADDLAGLEQADTLLAADPRWLPLVDRIAPAYQPAETLWHQRIC